MKDDAEVLANRDDREYLQRPHLWPGQGPTKCYVKRGHTPQGWRETGPCVLWGTEPLELVIRAHHWKSDALEPAPHAQSVQVLNDLVTVLTYTSVDDVLADGWEVD